MKKLVCFMLCFVLMASLTLSVVHAEPAAIELPTPPQIAAKSGVLMDAKTGTILYEKNANEKMPPASVTKIMTLLLTMEAIENGKLQYTDKITTSTHASKMGGSQIWLKENEVMTVDDLLKATAIASANDAATALAEHVGGSEEAFVAMMNDRAAELSMANTSFKNPTGLDAEGHLTTAYDIALMSCELLKHRDVTKYTSTWMDSLRDGATELVNTNKLVRFYKGCTGLKTGTTDKAGSCVSVSALRDGMELVAVVMGCTTSKDRFESARALLDYGFANFALYTPFVSEKELAPIKVEGGVCEFLTLSLGENSEVIIPKGKKDLITKKIEIAQNLTAPIVSGQSVGKLVLLLDNKELLSIDILANHEIKEMNFWHALGLLFSSML